MSWEWSYLLCMDQIKSTNPPIYNICITMINVVWDDGFGGFEYDKLDDYHDNHARNNYVIVILIS